MAQRQKLATLSSRDETPEPSPRDVFEEYPLHRILGAETEDLVPLWLDQLRRQPRETVVAVPYVRPMRNP